MKPHLPVFLFRTLCVATLSSMISVQTVCLASETKERNLSCSTYNREYENGTLSFVESQTGVINLCGYERIDFNNLIGKVPFYWEGEWEESMGGAIFLTGNSCISDNGCISFKDNSADIGGAISSELEGNYWNNSIVMSGNEEIVFTHNTATYEGGAINNDYYNELILCDNKEISFIGNSASVGGAIRNDGQCSLSRNAVIIFSSNSGGAICSSSSFSVTDNGTVKFVGNFGGAVCLADVVEPMFQGNNEIIFTDNIAANGGAMSGWGVYRGNGTVLFSGNKATGQHHIWWPNGAYNPHVPAEGGAIAGACELIENEYVAFIGNSATASSGYKSAAGGAVFISTGGNFEVIGNKEVLFSQNVAEAGSFALGGAICAVEGETFAERDCENRIVTLSGNQNVVFEKNAEISNGSYRLRSIYSAGILNLSAPEDKSILFKDSVYASYIVNLNQDGGGDIIFTGATTEEDLREMKGGIDGTAAEIRSSRSSVLDADVTLFAGTVQVRDGAGLTVKNLTANTGSELLLHDASFTVTGATLLDKVSVSGNTSIAAGVNASIALQQAITNDGNLTISGVIDASALEVEEIPGAGFTTTTYINTAGESGDSGFFATDRHSLQIVVVEGSGTLDATSAIVKYNEGILSLGGNGIATGYSRSVDYSTYHLNGETVSMTSILSYSPSAVIQMTGGTLTVDTEATQEIIHDKDASLNFTVGQAGGKSFSGYRTLDFNSLSSPLRGEYGFSTYGGAIHNGEENVYGGYNEHVIEFALTANGKLAFVGNSISEENHDDYGAFISSNGGAVYNSGLFLVRDNDVVTFSANSVSSLASSNEFDDEYYTANVDASGGAIYNLGAFSMSGNGKVDFSGNTLSAIASTDEIGDGYREVSANTMGGAIYNSSTFSLLENGNVAFIGNSAYASSSVSNSDYYYGYYEIGANAKGGAIYNGSDFKLSNNGDIIFSGNSVTAMPTTTDGDVNLSAIGGAIYSNGSFTLTGNGDVLFEKNAEINNGTYHLRSIYAQGTLNISAADGKTILFNDSIYCSGSVNLNMEGSGDIIFSGATTEADLREVKGGIDGTEQEISASRRSVLYGVVTLGGGRLQVRDGASLSVHNMTSADGAELVLHDACYTATYGASLSAVTVSGDSSIIANGKAGMTLQQAITNNGSLKLEGTINADLLTWTGAEEQTYINADGERSADGFLGKFSSGQLMLVEGSGTLDVTSAVVKYKGSILEVGINGIASGHYANIDYGTYYLNSGSASLSAILAKNSTANVQMAGGTLLIDTKSPAAISHDKNSSLDIIVSQSGGNSFTGYRELVIRDIVSTQGYGDNAIWNEYGTSCSINDNGTVALHGNSAKSEGMEWAYAQGGAISNESDFECRGNGMISFCRNSVQAAASLPDDADAEYYWMEVSAIGGAVCNYGNFELIENGNVVFSCNSVSATTAAHELSSAYCYSSAYGGAIYNDGAFFLSDNGDVLFEKNVEISNDSYRLRSIYSLGELNLSSSSGHSVTFNDSVYACGSVKLNQRGTGDIIFSGATTEADLREVKGGVAGTAEEILNSRTSEIATNVKLYGGRLIVEDSAILKGQGITVTEGANATIRLNGATLDETGYAIAVSAGSGLEFEGENVLNAGSVQMADGAFLSFVMGEGSGTNWDAQLITGQLNVQVSGDLFNEHRLLTLNDASQYDTSRWTRDAVTVSGAGFDSLSWADGVLTYTPHVITPDADGSLDDALPDDGNAIIDGNGHTLTVKNEVQLVQMALKEGIVKLEGENNGIVSVTLTEGGELVLTAGAGLKTGDIISMVASGKGELVISGDITLDNKGMKGKAGARATVSHADAQVLGDATISNVRVEDSVIDLAEGSTVTFSHVSLAAGSRITDDPATLALDDVTAELKLGVNAAVVSVDEVLHAGSTLVQNGNETMSLTLAQDAVVVQLEATTFDSVTLTGDSLVLQLSGVETEFFNGADYIAVSFTSGTGLATFGTDLEVLLTLDEEHFVHGFYVQGGNHTAMLFATNDKAVVTPEPATATLSLLALAALAARRRRK